MSASCNEPSEIVWINDCEAPTLFYTGFMWVRGPNPDLGYICLYEDLPALEPGGPIRRRVVAYTVGHMDTIKDTTPMREHMIREYDQRRH